MSRTLKSADTSPLLIPAVDEVPRIGAAERARLRVSLERASADIAAGRFDVVTSEALRAEFDGVFRDGKSDAEIDGARPPSCGPQA